MALGLRSVGTVLTVVGVLAGLALLLCGAIIAWAFRVLFTVSLAFWAPGLDLTVAFSGLWQMGRYPVSIYSRPVRLILTYVVPVAFVSTVPVRVLTHGPDAPLMLESLLVVCGSVVLVVITWRAGLRRYTGATT
jgi:ABC-2 type transport system permease protein